jgi:HAD superfamily hydrolase (TIGR01549 family)
VLLLFDLDNTLIERSGAFGRWAEQFIAEIGGDPDDLAWLIKADADGYTPRSHLADAMLDRFGLSHTTEHLVGRLMTEHVEIIEAVPGVPAMLESLGAQGIRRILVTNGTESQQRRKLVVTDLGRLLDAVIISETVGCRKPDPRIFQLALAGRPSQDAWMIGDHPDADIRGGSRAGLRTGWVHRGQPWVGSDPPTLSGVTAPAVIDAVLASTPGEPHRAEVRQRRC